MNPFSARRISDPVYGTIGLSDLEMRIIDTRAFQRLRNVKHLGLAHLVFPGADYSRFSHCIGVCHITGRILEALRESGQAIIKDRQIQVYRLAGLLHDAGHYPFSHAMEQAVRDHYSNQLYMPKDDQAHQTRGVPSDLLRLADHEAVGKEILQQDTEIRRILTKARIKPEDVYRVFTREGVDVFTNLVSSDLDADRIDYLLRTTHATGLPYGSVDLDYLLSQFRLHDNELCLTAKAIRAVEHLLLSRFFTYMLVAYHRTVTAFELVLKDVIAILLEEEILDCRAPAMLDRISTGAWAQFDDGHVLDKIRTLAANPPNESAATKANVILERHPPALLAEFEVLGDRASRKRDFSIARFALRDRVPSYAEHFGIDRSLWYLWAKDIALTKIGARLPVSEGFLTTTDLQDSAHEGKALFEQSIRILKSDATITQPIMELDQSLMRILSDYAYYSLRLYVLLPPNKQDRKPEIRDYVRNDLRSRGIVQ